MVCHLHIAYCEPEQVGLRDSPAGSDRVALSPLQRQRLGHFNVLVDLSVWIISLLVVVLCLFDLFDSFILICSVHVVLNSSGLHSLKSGAKVSPEMRLKRLFCCQATFKSCCFFFSF